MCSMLRAKFLHTSVGTFFRQDSNVRSSLAASLYFSAPEREREREREGEDTKLRFFVLPLSALHPVLLHPCNCGVSAARVVLRQEGTNAGCKCRNYLRLCGGCRWRILLTTCRSVFNKMRRIFRSELSSHIEWATESHN